MDKQDTRFQVRFTGRALEDGRRAFPDLPLGDEVVLWVEPRPCSVCGQEIGDGNLGCFDPESITQDGLLLGKHLCWNCAKAGN